MITMTIIEILYPSSSMSVFEKVSLFENFSWKSVYLKATFSWNELMVKKKLTK